MTAPVLLFWNLTLLLELSASSSSCPSSVKLVRSESTESVLPHQVLCPGPDQPPGDIVHGDVGLGHHQHLLAGSHSGEDDGDRDLSLAGSEDRGHLVVNVVCS